MGDTSGVVVTHGGEPCNKAGVAGKVEKGAGVFEGEAPGKGGAMCAQVLAARAAVDCLTLSDGAKLLLSRQKIIPA
jgi:hypothetical protein